MKPYLVLVDFFRAEGSVIPRKFIAMAESRSRAAELVSQQAQKNLDNKTFARFELKETRPFDMSGTRVLEV